MRIFVNFFLILLLTSTVWAKQPEILTLEESLILASQHNNDIKKALEYRNKVEGIYIQERSAALPRLSLNGTLMAGDDETQKILSKDAPTDKYVYGGQINLNQALFTWGQVGAAIRAAKIGLKTADDELSLYRQSVARDVSVAFYDLLMAIELELIDKQNYEQKKRHLDEAKRKFSVGMATDYDLLAAEVVVKNAWPEVIHSQNIVETLYKRLSILIGYEAFDFKINGSLDIKPLILPDYKKSFETAFNNRPELSALKNRLGIQKELVQVAKASEKPRFDLTASYGWQDIKSGDAHVNGNAASGAIIMSFPFFDGMRTKGAVMIAESEVKSLSLEEAKLKDGIKLQIVESINSLKESGEIVQSLTGTVTVAEKLLDMAEKGFAYGVKTNLDVQDALMNLKQAKGNLIRAKRGYLVSKVTLDWVMGIINLPKGK